MDPGVGFVCRGPLTAPKLSIERIANALRRFTPRHPDA
jgi:hypothetical protein